jgi:hypothetical protein
MIGSLDSAMVEVITRLYPDEPNPVLRLQQLCRNTFGSGSGRELLSILNHAVPPMAPSVREGADNDPAVVGMRDGRREVSALLFRYSGNPPAAPEQQQQPKKRTK